MKKFLLSTAVAIASLFMLHAGAQAETGVVVIHFAQDFIAGGKMLPAGTYKVLRYSPDTAQTLVLRGEGGSTFLLPGTFASTQAEQIGATLTQAGDGYYLSRIVTDLGVYTFPTPPALTRSAKVKNQESSTPLGD